MSPPQMLKSSIGSFPKLGGGGYFFEGPHNKAYNILGSILGSPPFGSYQFVN